jgi:hypothetical protein
MLVRQRRTHLNSPVGVLGFMAGLLALGATAAWGGAGQGLKITQIAYPGSPATVASAVNVHDEVVGNYIATSGAKPTKGFKVVKGKYTSVTFPKSRILRAATE